MNQIRISISLFTQNVFFSTGEPKTRPKLNLAPRTKPIETPPPLPQPPLDTPEEEPTPPPPPAPKPSAASIFGGAKPVDTAARERAIEEKLKAKAAAETDQETNRLVLFSIN